ncbi:MAG: type VI secretion system ATPase TssH [Pseudomonadales bacterium]
MIRIELAVLMERLNALSKHAVEEAAALCVSQQGAEISVEHLLFTLLETPYSDMRLILEQAQIDPLTLKNSLGARIAANKQPALSDYPTFSPLLVELLQDAWLLGSTEYRHSELRGGVFFLATLLNAGRYLGRETVELLSPINRESLRSHFEKLLAKSVEAPKLGAAKQAGAQPLQGADSLLDKYTANFTQMARDQALDPVLCREEEISLMIDILCRRRKNNPIVVGDAGVGKSAVIEGLAQRVVAGNVPQKLQQVELLSLDLGALQAGASVKGEFEKRLKGVIEEVKHAPHEIILFIDEAHTLIGAGNAEGAGDAANLLKPALARGELRTIGATTWKEYKKYFEKDPALSRRFQLVKLDEPSIEEAVHIMRGLSEVYERAHSVLIGDDALEAAAQLSARYISGRQLPDKAIDVLDTACARVAINLSARPERINRLEEKIRRSETELERLRRQRQLGIEVEEVRIEQIGASKEQLLAEANELTAAWSEQQGVVQQILALRAELADPETAADTAELGRELHACNTKLAQLQGAETLVNAYVDADQIARVIGDWTGVPVNQMSANQLSVITELPQYLGAQIKGQDIAIAKVHKHLLTARADLRKTGRPQGAFLLVGPSGVGKTETVIQLTERLYGGKQFLTTINMSEYQEKHTVSRLIGSPPGYVGFGEGGILTEAIRQKPYSVVLLDEVEKAHPEVLNLFYQAFDKGELADGEGRLIDCQNIMFFLTSNLGFQTIVDYAEQPEQMDDALYPTLAEFFKPALLARMEIVPYLPLPAPILEQIIGAKVEKLAQTLRERYRAAVEIDSEVITQIRARANRSENGARMIESVIDGQLLPGLSLQLLERLAAEQAVSEIKLAVCDQQFTCEVI